MTSSSLQTCLERDEGFFFHQGNAEIHGSRDATRAAFKEGLISSGEVWMEMILSRNRTSHTSDETTAAEISGKILHSYVELFNAFSKKMNELRNKEQ